MIENPLWDSPFFEDRHRTLARELATWDFPYADSEPEDLVAGTRTLARALAERGLLDHELPFPHDAGGEEAGRSIDSRTICLIREVLSYRSGFADVVFSMQGIGSAAIWMAANEELRAHYLPRVRRGEHVAALALSEPNAGSDVAAISTSARAEGDSFILNGTKTWISNAGAADYYIIIARTGEADGARGLSAFLLDAATPGLEVGPLIEFIAPHLGGFVQLRDCRVPRSRMLGNAGDGFRLAMATLDIFRPTVGGAALGVARRAYDETLAHVQRRQMFGGPMSSLDGVRNKVAEMATLLEASSLMVYQAAWARDQQAGRPTRAASMAKMFATEAAQKIVDSALQLHGGLGLVRDAVVERLYREVRPMRIYEGASEVQLRVIAREILGR